MTQQRLSEDNDVMVFPLKATSSVFALLIESSWQPRCFATYLFIFCWHNKQVEPPLSTALHALLLHFIMSFGFDCEACTGGMALDADAMVLPLLTAFYSVLTLYMLE